MDVKVLFCVCVTQRRGHTHSPPVRSHSHTHLIQGITGLGPRCGNCLCECACAKVEREIERDVRHTHRTQRFDTSVRAPADQVKHTSGREIFKDLMKYENFRQALRYLLYIVKYNPNAQNHPALQRMPEALRTELLCGDDSVLHELMASRSVNTSYTSGELKADDKQAFIRTGHSTAALQLFANERAEAKQLLLACEYEDDRAAIFEQLEQPVRGVAWLCLSGRSRHIATIYAFHQHSDYKSGTRVNYTHYSVDTALPHGSTSFEGSVVRVHHLFLLGDLPLACVTWGEALQVDTKTGCREYRFHDRQSRPPPLRSVSSSSSSSAPPTPLPNVIHARRLVSYVHFGVLPGSRLVLNRFYIPGGLESDRPGP